MPKYRYTAKDLDNQKITNTIMARDVQDFKKRMRALNLVPISYKEIEEKQSGYRLKANEISEFARQLSSMLDSGITVVRAMEIIKDRDFKPALKLVFERLHRDTQNGCTLSEAMRMQKKAFPSLFVNMFASGEASGKLERAAAKMAVHYDKENRLNGKIKTAMTYPVILIVFTIIVVIVVFTVVLPEFFSLFEGQSLPALTQAVMGISAFLRNQWKELIIGTLLLFGFIAYLRSIDSVVLILDKAKLRIPKIGKLLKIIYTARFARTLSSLYSSGLTMLNALDIASTTLGNKYIQSQFVTIIKDVRNGEPLSEAISKIDGFDKKLTTTILIGEESGRLDSMLESVAEAFDYEAEIATSRMVQMIEPIMIVVMAVVIGVVMISVVSPLMSFYDNVGNM